MLFIGEYLKRACVHWRKVAIVSDQEGVRKITDVAGHFVPGEYKGFPIADLDQAIEWAAT